MMRQASSATIGRNETRLASGVFERHPQGVVHRQTPRLQRTRDEDDRVEPAGTDILHLAIPSPKNSAPTRDRRGSPFPSIPVRTELGSQQMSVWPRADAAGIAAHRFALCHHIRRYIDGVGVLIALLIGHAHAQPQRSTWSRESGAEQASVAANHRPPRLAVDPELGSRDRNAVPGRGSDLAADVCLAGMRRDPEPSVGRRRDHDERPLRLECLEAPAHSAAVGGREGEADAAFLDLPGRARGSMDG